MLVFIHSNFSGTCTTVILDVFVKISKHNWLELSYNCVDLPGGTFLIKPLVACIKAVQMTF